MDTSDQRKFTEKDLFQIFVDVDRVQKKTPQEREYYNHLNTSLPPSCRILKSDINVDSAIRKYKRKKQQKLSTAQIIQLASTDIVLCVDVPSVNELQQPLQVNDEKPPAAKKLRGPVDFNTSFSTSYKDFDDMLDRQRRNITEPLIQMLNTFLEVNQFSISLNRLLAYLLLRENIQSEPSIAQIGKDIYSEQIIKTTSFSPLEAVSLMHNMVLSKEQMRRFRYFLAQKNIEFPTTNSLLPVRKSLRPQTFPVLDGKGRGVEYKELVTSTISSVIKVVSENLPDMSPQNMIMYVKDGGDGAGTMPSLKSKQAGSGDCDHIFQYGIIPLKLTHIVGDKEEILWKNKVPNAARSLRPVFLIREVESNPELLNFVIKETDEARNDLNENGVKINAGEEEVHVSCVIKDSMKDLKLKKLIIPTNVSSERCI